MPPVSNRSSNKGNFRSEETDSDNLQSLRPPSRKIMLPSSKIKTTDSSPSSRNDTTVKEQAKQQIQRVSQTQNDKNYKDMEEKERIAKERREPQYFPAIEPGAVAAYSYSNQTTHAQEGKKYHPTNNLDEETSNVATTAIVNLQNSDSDFRVASALSEYDHKVRLYDTNDNGQYRTNSPTHHPHTFPRQQEQQEQQEGSEKLGSSSNSMMVTSQAFGRAVAVRPGNHERVRPKGYLTVLPTEQMDAVEQLRMATNMNDSSNEEEAKTVNRFSSESLQERSSRSSSSNTSTKLRSYWQEHKNTTRFKVIVGGFILLAIILAISIPLATSGSGGNENNESRRQDVFQIVSNVSDVALLQQTDSVQNAAFEWVVQDTTLSLVGTNNQKLIVRYALAVFYLSTGGKKQMSVGGDDIFTVSSSFSSWILDKNWLDQNEDECQWEFITCNNNQIIDRIDISQNNGLEGSLPDELKALSTSLRFLSIQSNRELTGTLPVGLYELSNLESLELQDNGLFGEISPLISKLTALEIIDFANNDFEGGIPVDLYDVTSLVHLGLLNNGLSGKLSSSIMRLSSLEHMLLAQNSLTGSVPIEMYQNSFPSLIELDFSFNELQGNITEIISGLSPLQELYFLELNANQFTGNIPTEVGMMKNLQVLHLDSNEISSTLPSEMGLLTNLDQFWFSSTEISGTVPAELCFLGESTDGLVCNKNVDNCNCCSTCQRLRS